MLNSSRIFVVHLLMAVMPSTRFFPIKRGLIRWAGAEVGANVRVASSARFLVGGRLVIGANTWIGHEVLIVGGDAEVIIGENVDIGPRTLLVTGTHEPAIETDRAAGRGYSLPIDIGDGVWIGASSTVIGGVSIGKSSIVAAGSLVNKNLEARQKYGGVPARELN